MKYTGIIASIEIPSQSILFQKQGQWPRNWRVEATILTDKVEFLKTLEKGQLLTVEGDLGELHHPTPDADAFAIRLENTRIGDSATVPKAPPIVVEGVRVDLPHLINSLASVNPELEAAARNIQLACRYRDYAKGSALAESLAKDTRLDPKQREFALVVLEQLKEVVAKAASPSAR